MLHKLKFPKITILIIVIVLALVMFYLFGNSSSRVQKKCAIFAEESMRGDYTNWEDRYAQYYQDCLQENG